jgi:hypothetical protein
MLRVAAFFIADCRLRIEKAHGARLTAQGLIELIKLIG